MDTSQVVCRWCKIPPNWPKSFPQVHVACEKYPPVRQVVMCDLRKQDKPDPRLAVSCEQQCRKREMDVKILTWDQRGFIYRVREHACWEGGLQDRESRSCQRGVSDP